MDAVEKKNAEIIKKANGINFYTYSGTQWWAQQSNNKFREAFRMFTFRRLVHVLGVHREFNLKITTLINKCLSLLHSDVHSVLLIPAFMNEEEAWRDYEKYLLTAAVNSDYFLNKVLSGKLNLLEVRQQAYLFYNEFIAFIVDNDRVFIDSLTAEEKALILAHRMGKTV